MSISSVYGTSLDRTYDHQPPWAHTAGDSLQYELFFGDRFLSVRGLKFPSCEFISAWMFDQGVADLFSTYEPLQPSEPQAPGVYAHNDKLSLKMGAGGGQILIQSEGRGALTVDLEETVSTLWRFPPDDVVIHQPLLKASLSAGAEKCEGIGYAKRYTFGPETEHMYWRFISGPVPTQPDPGWLWTAEASFDLKKYDYFKRASANGQIITASQPGTWHRDQMAHGTLDGVEHTVEIEDLGRINRRIQGPGTDLKFSQAFCQMSVRAGDETYQSRALNEIACGSHA